MAVTILNEQIPEFLRLIETALRSGYSIVQALVLVTQDMDAPMATSVQETLDEIVQGVDLLQALDNWVQRTADPDLDLFVALFKVQVEVGGNLADKLQLLGQVLDQRQLKA